MKRRTLLLASTLTAVCPLAAHAQSWPARPIRFILTAPPGSSVDVLGRLIADRLHQRIGQPVVADNRAAAGGTVGTDTLAKSAPDGYTLGLSFTGPLSLAPYLYTKLPYDPVKDLAPVVLLGTAPNLLAVNTRMPVNSVHDLIAYARRHPGRLNYASVGNGSTSHLAMEQLKTQGKLHIVHIPYNGAPPAAQAAAAGEVQLIMSNPTSLLPLIKAGRIKPLAVTSRARWQGMKDLPTLAESGFPGFEAVAWNGVLAPAGTSPELIERLNREINAILADPEFRQRMEGAGWDPAGGSVRDFTDFMAAERTRWGPVVERSGAKVD